MNGGLMCKVCGWTHYPGRFKPAACEHCGASMEPTTEAEVQTTQESTCCLLRFHCLRCDYAFEASMAVVTGGGRCPCPKCGDYLQHLYALKSDGSTASYYQLPSGATELQDLISFRNMNAQLGEIFRAAYRYGQASHSDCLRDAKKIKFYAEAEIARLEKYGEKK